MSSPQHYVSFVNRLHSHVIDRKGTLLKNKENLSNSKVTNTTLYYIMSLHPRVGISFFMPLSPWIINHTNTSQTVLRSPCQKEPVSKPPQEKCWMLQIPDADVEVQSKRNCDCEPQTMQHLLECPFQSGSSNELNEH